MTTKPKRPITPARDVTVDPPPVPTTSVKPSPADDLEASINRAYNKPLTQEERAFLAGLRSRIDAEQELSEFDRGWLAELSSR